MNELIEKIKLEMYNHGMTEFHYKTLEWILSELEKMNCQNCKTLEPECETCNIILNLPENADKGITEIYCSEFKPKE